MQMQELVSIFKFFSFSSLCSKLVQIDSNQRKDPEFDFEYEITRLQNQITELNEKLHKHYLIYTHQTYSKLFGSAI